jgi:hypothetical protein
MFSKAGITATPNPKPKALFFQKKVRAMTG